MAPPGTEHQSSPQQSSSAIPYFSLYVAVDDRQRPSASSNHRINIVNIAPPQSKRWLQPLQRCYGNQSSCNFSSPLGPISKELAPGDFFSHVFSSRLRLYLFLGGLIATDFCFTSCQLYIYQAQPLI